MSIYFETIQYNTMQYNTMQREKKWCKTAKYKIQKLNISFYFSYIHQACSILNKKRDILLHSKSFLLHILLPSSVLNIIQDIKSNALLATLENASYALSLTRAICNSSIVNPAPNLIKD